MRILILNGSQTAHGASMTANGDSTRVVEGEATTQGRSSPLSRWTKTYGELMRSRGAEVEEVFLDDLAIQPCTGCWSCWLATPGRCARKDGLSELYPRILGTDLLLWASPLFLGAQNSLVKKTQDRLIPLIHPYIELVEGECHHRRRYNQYPRLGLVVQPTKYDGDEDLQLVKRLFERFALNMRSSLSFFSTTDDRAEEAADATLSA